MEEIERLKSQVSAKDAQLDEYSQAHDKLQAEFLKLKNQPVSNSSLVGY